MVHQSLAIDEGIEICMRKRDTWQAIATSLRIDAHQGLNAYARQTSEVNAPILLSMDWQATTPQEMAAVGRWSGKRALELARNKRTVLQAHVMGTDRDASKLRTCLAGQMGLWVALHLLGNFTMPLLAGYSSKEEQP